MGCLPLTQINTVNFEEIFFNGGNFCGTIIQFMSANHRERRANLANGSIIVASLDLIKSGIRPIQLLGIVVNGETIGRLDFCCDDIMHLVARQVGCLNACLSVVPVGPIHSPVTKVIIICRSYYPYLITNRVAKKLKANYKHQDH